MRLQEISTGLEPHDGCPICSARIKLVEVEPHPSHDGLEIHGFSCALCGPVMSVVVRCPVEEEPTLLMLM